jgi:NAD(P)H-dependent flavin oxidoreductase YrpB (nitropropane dioxygenase family)
MSGGRSFRESTVARRFGLRHPILSAPMGAVAGGLLAAAVSRAGGLGFIGAGYQDAGWIEGQFRAAERTPVGLASSPGIWPELTGWRRRSRAARPP